MDIKTVLTVPAGECEFDHPGDAPSDGFDRRYRRLRVERRGLLSWTSFEENPQSLQELLDLPTKVAKDWCPYIPHWVRYLASELSMVDLLKKTIVERVNISLDTASPGMSIVGTPKHFGSYGTDENRTEGDWEVRIGPDFVVLDTAIGQAPWPPELSLLESMTIAIGDAKVKRLDGNAEKKLPGTLGCYESWLAQPVQCCIDLDIPLGFVVTNVEIVFFHVLKEEGKASSWIQTRTTRSTTDGATSSHALPSDGPEEAEYSSPMIRTTRDWPDFLKGDVDIPFVSNIDLLAGMPAQSTPRSTPRAPHQPPRPAKSHLEWQPQSPSSPLPRKRRRYATPETASTAERNSASVPTTASSSFSTYGTSSPPFDANNHRNEDMTYILIKSYDFGDEKIGQRLFEFIMLAKRAKKLGLLYIGPHKLSHSAVDHIENTQ